LSAYLRRLIKEDLEAVPSARGRTFAEIFPGSRGLPQERHDRGRVGHALGRGRQRVEGRKTSGEERTLMSGRVVFDRMLFLYAGHPAQAGVRRSSPASQAARGAIRTVHPPTAGTRSDARSDRDGRSATDRLRAFGRGGWGDPAGLPRAGCCFLCASCGASSRQRQGAQTWRFLGLRFLPEAGDCLGSVIHLELGALARRFAFRDGRCLLREKKRRFQYGNGEPLRQRQYGAGSFGRDRRREASFTPSPGLSAPLRKPTTTPWLRASIARGVRGRGQSCCFFL